MNVCGLSRLVTVAFLVGFGVSTLTGNDVHGWIAAAVSAIVLIAVRRIRRTGASCAIEPSSGGIDDVDEAAKDSTAA